MKKHRIKAFTIMEVTISMLIASIVIGITYSVYLIIIYSYHSFHIKNEDMQTLTQADKLLRKDFANADSVTKTQNGIVFKKDSSTIEYNFQPDYILRKSSLIDTFKIKSQDINTLFENQQIYTHGRIDELTLDILFEDEKIPYHYFKQYSSADLVEKSPNAIN